MDVGHNNGDADHEWTFVSRKQRKPRTSPTIFIANIPEQLQVDSLKGIFQRFGRVVHASIPNRRTKRFNSRFGFIRYERPASAEEAVRKFNRAWYGDYHLIVSPARFERPPYPKHFMTEQNLRSNFHEARHSNTLNLSSVQNQSRPSYADIVKNNVLACDHAKKVQVSEPSIKVHATEAGNEWLSRSVVVKASLPNTDQSILSSFSPEDARKIQVRAMGGKSFVLTFDSQEDMRNRIHNNKDWFNSRFEDAQEWSLWKQSNLSSRTVWLNCYGVPLNLWNSNTFKSIGRVWGEVILVDVPTLKHLSFDCGKVMIVTNQFEVINRAITLVCKHEEHIIRVAEEQIMSFHMSKAAGELSGQEDDDVFFPMDVDNVHPIRVEQHGTKFSNGKELISQDRIPTCVRQPSLNGERGRQSTPTVTTHAVKKADQPPRSNFKELGQTSTYKYKHIVPSPINSLLPLSPSTPISSTPSVSNTQPHFNELNFSNKAGPSHSKTIHQEDPIHVQSIAISQTHIHANSQSPRPHLRSQSLVIPNSHSPLLCPHLRSHHSPSPHPHPIPPHPEPFANSSQSIVPDSILSESASLEPASRVPDNHWTDSVTGTCKPLVGLSKRKSKRKFLQHVLGNASANKFTRRGGRKKGGKAASIRSAAAAISLSISSEAIANRNRIILNEAQAVWEIGKLLGLKTDEEEDEVVSKLKELHDQNDLQNNEAKGERL